MALRLQVLRDIVALSGLEIRDYGQKLWADRYRWLMAWAAIASLPMVLAMAVPPYLVLSEEKIKIDSIVYLYSVLFHKMSLNDEFWRMVICFPFDVFLF